MPDPNMAWSAQLNVDARWWHVDVDGCSAQDFNYGSMMTGRIRYADGNSRSIEFAVRRLDLPTIADDWALIHLMSNPVLPLSSFLCPIPPPSSPSSSALIPCILTLPTSQASTRSLTPPLPLLHHVGRRPLLRRTSPIKMSDCNICQQADLIELREESDFEKLISPSGLISICGFGSLLSERSARSSFPDLINFRVARLNGFRRVFAHVAPVFFERGIAKPETKEISSLSVEPCEGETLIVTVFEIQKSEIPAFMERELEFRFLTVMPEALDGKPFGSLAVLCARYSDEEFFEIRCKGSKETYFQHYGRYNIDKIWRDDILPCRVYLRHCVLAAKNLNEAAYNNFLDHTYLADRKTMIRMYLEMSGSGIMEEEPPESLKTRYGG